jgi:zinc and cadmium transporter
MTDTWLLALASTLLVSLASLLGIVVLWASDARMRGALFLFVSLAAGALLGDAFIHLLPEAFAASTNPPLTSVSVLGGIVAFFGLEKLLRWRHQHSLEPDMHVHPVGPMNLIADALHNLIDGALIAASYLASPAIGIATTVAVILHEVPQEIGDFGVLLHAGFSKAQALGFNFFSASLAIVGAAATLLIGSQIGGIITMTLVPLTAGMFIYVAGVDLLPEMHKENDPARSLLQLIMMGTGVAIMLSLLLFE